MKSHPLTDLLMIDHSLLNEEGKEAIDYLESLVESRDQQFSFEKFKVKLRCQRLLDFDLCPLLFELLFDRFCLRFGNRFFHRLGGAID